MLNRRAMADLLLDVISSLENMRKDMKALLDTGKYREAIFALTSMDCEIEMEEAVLRELAVELRQEQDSIDTSQSDIRRLTQKLHKNSLYGKFATGS